MNYKKAYLYIFNRMTDLGSNADRSVDSEMLRLWIRDIQTQAEEIVISE